MFSSILGRVPGSTSGKSKGIGLVSGSSVVSYSGFGFVLSIPGVTGGSERGVVLGIGISGFGLLSGFRSLLSYLCQ